VVLPEGPAPRLIFFGDSALTVEFEERVDPVVNARAIAFAEALDAAGHPGVRDVVPTYRSVTVHFDPLRVGGDRLLAHIHERLRAPWEPRAEREPMEVPVRYGGECGPDLAAVARFAGCSEAEVIRIHSSRLYRVYMLGFLPGYAYMGMVDERIAIGRHATPRMRVPAGAVGVARLQTSISSMDAPGGWHIIGRTPVRTFDPASAEPFLLKPGDTVRFVPQPRAAGDPGEAPASAPAAAGPDEGGGIWIISGGMLSTVQDLGRWGYQRSGVPAGGPMDRASHRLANALVGNPPEAATIEITLIGPEIGFERETLFAVTGGEFCLTLGGRSAPMNTVCRARPGMRLRFGARRHGARAYIAVAGGIDVPAVLGSRATHLPSAMGGVAGRALRSGDHLPVGRPHRGQTVEGRSAPPVVPLPRGGARLRLVLGPQDDFFTDRALVLLQTSRYRITADSNRMAYRLEGPPLEHARGADTISDATLPGALQVPASGQPILLAADSQTTGGYPKPATVISADLPVAGQLAPGDWIEFALCSRRDAMAALIAQERRLMARR
jgi:KipI family sensor histidine kinase inhibitor